MALPAYLLAQPKTNPTEILVRQFRNLDLDVDIMRHGQTITIRNLELSDDNERNINRALRLLSMHADSNHLTVDAIIHPIHENIIDRYQAAGFIVHHEADGEHGEDICTLMRRAIRN